MRLFNLNVKNAEQNLRKKNKLIVFLEKIAHNLTSSAFLRKKRKTKKKTNPIYICDDTSYFFIVINNAIPHQ